ncbi:uncharacterized protein LTHEOB_10325 [Neofusicoccum parvum]|uniref:Uncharacterized protein LTHEOB_10325 n=1 Tax=Neofusicoccum parvum TaxID=310453 RepID=A0ACB5RTQ3_9PEZI|nr:uncharacterized protein LTHEOB_10325 [Neofusicoccum parvum]
MIKMVPAWCLAAPNDEVANELRTACAAFLKEATKFECLPPEGKFPEDMTNLSVYKCLVNRPTCREQGINTIINYDWYKAVPAWMNDSFWTVRVDHFVPSLEEHKPITFFSTKTALPGGMYIYHRFTFDGGVIAKRSLLGFLDPLATSDINATRPVMSDAFLPSPEATADKEQVAANGMLYDQLPAIQGLNISSKRDRISPFGEFPDNKRIKTDGPQDDPFVGPGGTIPRNLVSQQQIGNSISHDEAAIVSFKAQLDGLRTQLKSAQEILKEQQNTIDSQNAVIDELRARTATPRRFGKHPSA